jgi:hypothetical protein
MARTRGSYTHTTETRVRIAERLADPDVKARHKAAAKAAWEDPDKRRQASERARETHADPAMRAKISQRTKEGILAAAGMAPELTALRSAWQGARPAVRKRFLAELMAELVEAADVGRA